MKRFKSIVTILIVLALSMLVFVSCDKAKAQQKDYSAYQGVFYLKDGDVVNKNVWFHLKGDGTWQDNYANCGTYSVDNILDGNIGLEGDLTLTGHIKGALKLYIDGNEVEYARSTDAEIPAPPVEIVCAKYGHDLQSYQAKEPTCIADGYEAYFACKREGCAYSTKQVIPRLGHAYENGKCVRCGENAPTQEEIENSERIKGELQNDAPDKKPQDIIVPVVPTKEDGATDEQIALAQQQADEAIEEKSYWTIVEIVKNWYARNYTNSKEFPDSYVRKINSIKESSFKYSLAVEIEVIYTDSKCLLRKHIVVLEVNVKHETHSFSSAKELLEFFDKYSNGIEFLMEFDADNSEYAVDFYNCKLNKAGDNKLIASSTVLDNNGNISLLKMNVYDNNSSLYVKYDLSAFVEYWGIDELKRITKSGELAYYACSTLRYLRATDIAYDWESANVKYRKS